MVYYKQFFLSFSRIFTAAIPPVILGNNSVKEIVKAYQNEEIELNCEWNAAPNPDVWWIREKILVTTMQFDCNDEIHNN